MHKMDCCQKTNAVMKQKYSSFRLLWVQGPGKSQGPTRGVLCASLLRVVSLYDLARNRFKLVNIEFSVMFI